MSTGLSALRVSPPPVIELYGVMGSFLTMTVLYLKYDFIVLGAGDSASLDFIGDSNFAFGYQLYFLGKLNGG